MSTHFHRLLATMAVSIGLAACTDVPSAPVAAPAEARVARQGGNGGPIPGQYLVVFKRDVSDAPGLARRLAAAHGGKVHHSYQHAIKGFAASLSDAAVAALRRNPNVAYVEQDQRVSIATASWGLDRVDQRDLPLDYGYSTVNSGAGVTVYVLDTGIETSHWDFGGRAKVGLDVIGDGYNGQDCNGHGTHVAGTVGGNSYGVAKAVNLVSVRVLDCRGAGSWSGIIAGIEWVRDNHAPTATVANLSLTGASSQAVNSAIESLIANGVTVTVAAGNESWDACYYSPAGVPSAITVGASNSGDYQYRISNYGGCVDLYAPGEEIPSAWVNGGVSVQSGTSMAAPHVAGAAALYLEGNPWAEPWEVASVILSNATPDRLSFLGNGSPNLLLYVGIDAVTPTSPLSAYISGPSTVNSGPWTWEAVASGGDGRYSYQWEHSRDTYEWTNVGTNSPTYTHQVIVGHKRFYLRVTVTSNGSSYTTPAFRVDPDCDRRAC